MKSYIHVLVWIKRHLFGQLKPQELDTVVQFLHAESVVFDIGAHSGSWAYNLSKRLPKSEIYSFEAFPYYSKVLRKTLNILGCGNVTVITAAISSAEGEIQFVTRTKEGKKLTGMNHIANDSEKDNSELGLVVDMTTIDIYWSSIGQPTVNFIKLDIEGAELKALKGAVGVIKRDRPLILCELVREWCARYGHSCQDVIKFIRDLDYCVGFLMDGKIELYDDGLADWHYNDAFFIPLEKSSMLL